MFYEWKGQHVSEPILAPIYYLVPVTGTNFLILSFVKLSNSRKYVNLWFSHLRLKKQLISGKSV